MVKRATMNSVASLEPLDGAAEQRRRWPGVLVLRVPWAARPVGRAKRSPSRDVEGHGHVTSDSRLRAAADAHDPLPDSAHMALDDHRRARQAAAARLHDDGWSLLGAPAVLRGLRRRRDSADTRRVRRGRPRRPAHPRRRHHRPARRARRAGQRRPAAAHRWRRHPPPGTPPAAAGTPAGDLLRGFRAPLPRRSHRLRGADQPRRTRRAAADAAPPGGVRPRRDRGRSSDANRERIGDVTRAHRRRSCRRT